MQEPTVPAAAQLAVALTRWTAFCAPVPPQPWETELLLSVASALQMLSQKQGTNEKNPNKQGYPST